MFANPEFFGLLLLLPAAAWWYRHAHPHHYATVTFSNLAAFGRESSWRGQLRGSLPILRGLAFAAIVVALARPQSFLKNENIHAEGIDIMLTLDLSSSMLAEDFAPNRLEAAKKVASDFVAKRPYDRIGLVVFAGEAFTQCPLTTDHAVLREFLAKLDCGFLQDGTAIGMGLATAVNRLKESEAKSRIAILMSDGENTAGYFKPDVATALAKEKKVKVYTIGIGSQGEALSPVGRRSDGTYIMGLVPVSIDEALLQNIATTTGGNYYRAKNMTELARIYTEIDRLEKSKIDVSTLRRRSENFHPWLWAALTLLVLELLLRYSIFRTIP
ncbi:MAG: hypothetical protein RL329_2088 [Bacteroidota bacterium]